MTIAKVVPAIDEKAIHRSTGCINWQKISWATIPHPSITTAIRMEKQNLVIS
ncbi:hypothetical protein [Microcoleus sp. EPA2]|jgi:hypothetical protein|uniref:hypothetical protein n=1 Tax=Microcoleus sp. EPA2 TaxID=2841654 RepID=UPI00312B9013